MMKDFVPLKWWQDIIKLCLSGNVAWFLLSLTLFDFPSRYFSQKLAIVIPFTESDMPRLRTNLDSWTQFVPCDDSPSNSDLIFYFNWDWSKKPGILEELKGISKSKAIKKCFNRVRFLMANLSPNSEQDQYPLGASVMFFRLWELPIILDDYDFLYWMEPDQSPCRKGWLSQLNKLAISRPDFWMIGSIIRDDQPSNTYSNYADHINGNSLYRVDGQFLEYLDKVQEEFRANKSRFLSSFDIAIYLVARFSLPFSRYAAIKHHFQYTEVVQNVYRSHANITTLCREFPNTYLVHGRYLTS